MGDNNGKGDKPRKDLDLAKYRENYDKIFRNSCKGDDCVCGKCNTGSVSNYVAGCDECGCIECCNAKFKRVKGNKLND